MAGTEVQVANLSVEEAKAKSVDGEDGVKPVLDGSQIPRFLTWKLIPVAFAAMMVTWSFGWLYIGETWDPISWMKNIQIAILNCDNGLDPTYPLPPGFAAAVGIAGQPLASSLIYQLAWNETGRTHNIFFWLNLTCKAVVDNNYPGPGCGPYYQECYEQAVNAIDDGDYWEVLYWGPNFTMDYLSWYAPATSGASGQYLKPGQLAEVVNILSQGRSFTTLGFINGVLGTIWTGLKATVFSSVVQVATAFPEFVNPEVYTQPLNLREDNLAPVEFFGQNFASYVFCILLWLGSTFCVAVFNQYHSPAQIKDIRGEEPTPKEKWMGIGMKAGFAILYMFTLSVLLNCILFSLGKGDTAWYKNAGESMAFGWWLSFSYIAINTLLLFSLGSARFSSISAFLLVLQLTSAGAIFSEELSSRFFMIGKGLPFYYGVRGFRTIFWGATENWYYINWLVILAWNVVAVAAALMITYFRAYKPLRSAIAKLDHKLQSGGDGGHKAEDAAASPPAAKAE